MCCWSLIKMFVFLIWKVPLMLVLGRNTILNIVSIALTALILVIFLFFGIFNGKYTGVMMDADLSLSRETIHFAFKLLWIENQLKRFLNHLECLIFRFNWKSPLNWNCLGSIDYLHSMLKLILALMKSHQQKRWIIKMHSRERERESERAKRKRE